MDTVERYDRARKSLERLKEEESRRQGSEEVLLKRLKEEYDLPSLAAAEREIIALEKKRAKLESECSEILSEIEEVIDRPTELDRSVKQVTEKR